MAIIRPGPLAGAISGRLGGVVFVNGRRSAAVRPYAPPLRKSTLRLDKSRSFMGRIIAAWHDLTDAEQAAWNTAAANIKRSNRLGTTHTMTGFTYFVMVNKVTFQTKDAIATTPPRESVPLPPTSVAAVFSVAGDYAVTATRPAGATLITWQVFGWSSWTDHTPGEIPRPVFLFEITGFADLNRSIKTQWQERFGPVQVGQHFVVDVRGVLSAFPFHQTIRVFGIAVA